MSVCIFCFSLLVFICGIRSQEVTGFDSRFYLFALEMWEDGLKFFPTTYHQPYPDYTALSTALIYCVAKLFGGMNKLVAVLPTAIAAAATVVFTYLIGNLYHRRWGFYAVSFLLMTIGFLHDARSICIDIDITLLTTMCFYFLCSNQINNNHHKDVWIYLLLVIGFMFRGPIGLIIPAGVAMSYYAVDLQFKKLIHVGLISFALLIICTLMLLLIAYTQGGFAFVHAVFGMQGFNRINNYFLPYYFYFTNSFTTYSLCYPIVILVLLQFMMQQSQRCPIILFRLFAWILVIMIGMSIPGDKKPRYILPLAPALALCASYSLLAGPQQKILFLCKRILLNCLTILPSAFLFLVCSVPVYLEHHHFALNLPIVNVALILLLLQVFVITFRKRQIMVTVAACSFLMTYIAIVEPISLYLDRGGYFVRQIEQLRWAQNQNQNQNQNLNHSQNQEIPLVFYQEPPDGLPIKYIIHLQPHHPYPQFINSQQALLDFQGPAFFVTNADTFSALPMNIKMNLTMIAKNTFAHTAIVVFKKRRDKT